MTVAIAILSSLVGLNVAIKIYSLLKMFSIKVEGWEIQNYEELLKDKRFLKYMR